jgi:TM2 domain-containing membrane protein YozV
MNHRGHIQSGGQESGETWVEAVCSLGEETVTLLVSDIEVLSHPRATISFQETANEGVFLVEGAGEPIYFHPLAREAFLLDLRGPATAAERIRLAEAQRPPSPPKPVVGIATPGRSRIAAALLAIFLGGFGIHKFYLGQGGLGILYLVFFWTIIPAVIAFIEGIIFLLMSDAEFDRKYNAA